MRFNCARAGQPRGRRPAVDPQAQSQQPNVAAQRDLTGFYVFTVDGNRKASRADVVIGPPVDEYRTIKSGLTPDAEVIIKGLQRVRPGMGVDPETVTLPPIEQPGLGSGSVVSGESGSDKTDQAGSSPPAGAE